MSLPVPPPPPPPVIVTVPIPIPAFPPQPVQIDAITSIWDKIEAIGSLIGGIGSAGALIIIGITLCMQVTDKRRDQASRVTLSFDPPLFSFDDTFARKMTVDNASDLDVPSFRYYLHHQVADPHPTANQWMFGAPNRVGAHDTASFDVHGEYLQQVAIGFMDANGGQWIRLGNGALRRYRKRFRWF
jgi:hypothetical protein